MVTFSSRLEDDYDRRKGKLISEMDGLVLQDAAIA